ncbi:hypothetical protein Hanom_Chr03g00265461 [Helianthus anomalus]
MASISVPSPPSSPVEENVENVEVGDVLPILKWTIACFRALMLNVRRPEEYGARFPAEGDTTADATAGYVTLFADFFGEGNFRLPLTFFWPICWIIIKVISPSLVRSGLFVFVTSSTIFDPRRLS